MILTFRNPGKGHKGIFILFSQHFYVSTCIKIERIKGENKSNKIHCQTTFTKILITSKIKYLGEVLVEDGQNLWNSGSNRMKGCIILMIWKTQHCQCQSSSNLYVYSQIFKSNLNNTLKAFLLVKMTSWVLHSCEIQATKNEQHSW